ncbi:aspartate beta-hydroxylase domain-containing protein 2 isoform X2 [Anolis carolinensis]|uniref:aspartate beta-hydroxylase domain-containing protein 2 isoform X2 n=1 Tax=Anolis carolinensis TaxID=28377 RepID=UPI002F2B2EE7
MGFLPAPSLRDLVATGIHAFRDRDTVAVVMTATLAALFVWYCYRVGREQQQQQRRARAHNPVSPCPGGALPGGGPEGPFSNPRLYRNLQEYAKRYSWSGMGRIHKALRKSRGHPPGSLSSSSLSIQNPGVFFLPDLPSGPYFAREAQKHDVELLERNFPTILAELEGLSRPPDAHEYAHPHYHNQPPAPPPGWKAKATLAGERLTFDLVSRGTVVGRNCRRCPKTYRLLSGLRTCMATGNVFGNARFCALRPGTITEERYGPSNIRLRCHLGPAEEGPRVVFLVDLWHPNVAAAERQALDYIFAPGR